LKEASGLLAQQQFSAAAGQLETLLKQRPRHPGATLLLMRTYARELGRPESARALLDNFAPESHAPPGLYDYARRRIDEWSGAVPARQKTAENIESLLVDQKSSRSSRPPIATLPATASAEELLAAGHLATAIEMLEARVRAEPGNYESWLTLAEAHGVHCRDLPRAARIIDKLAANPAFNAEQIQGAKARLKEWRAHGR